MDLGSTMMSMNTPTLAVRHFSWFLLKAMTGLLPLIFLVQYSSVRNWSRVPSVFVLSPVAGFLGAFIFQRFIDGNVPLIAPLAAVTAGAIGGWLLPIGVSAAKDRTNTVLPEGNASPKKELASLGAVFHRGVAMSFPWSLGSYFYWAGLQKGSYWPEVYLGGTIAILWYLFLSPFFEKGLAELNGRGDPLYKKWHSLDLEAKEGEVKAGD